MKERNRSKESVSCMTAYKQATACNGPLDSHASCRLFFFHPLPPRGQPDFPPGSLPSIHFLPRRHSAPARACSLSHLPLIPN